MSKNQDSATGPNEPVDKDKRKQELAQQLKEEYQKLSYWQAGLTAVGVDTGSETYDRLNKEYLTLTNNLGIIDNITSAVTNTFGGSITAITEVKKLVEDVKAFKAAKKADDKPGSTEFALKTIKGLEPIVQNLSSILHSGVISDASKDTILQYVFTPYVFTPLLDKKLASKVKAKLQIPAKEKINILEGLSPRFIRELTTLAVDLASNGLAGDLNPKIQEIYKNLKQKGPGSQAIILQNVYDIITADKVNPLLKENLVKFLKNPENQKELGQVTENILNNKVQKFVAPELITNTIELIANSSDKLVESAPLAIEAFNKFKENQLWANTNLGTDGLSTADKKKLLEDKKPEVVKLINNTKKIVDNLSPMLKEELPKYLDTNKQHILGILDNPMVTEKIKTSGMEPALLHKAVDASIPFIKDALPSLTKLAHSSLADSDKVADIIQKAQLIKSLPKEEKSKEVKGLVSSIIQLQNDNPEIKQVIQQELPDLLTKHAEALGPVVDEFLKKTAIGQKLKLDGEKLIKIAASHTPDLINITDKFSKGKYISMIGSVLKLSTDPKVLGVIAESIINLGKSKFRGDKEVPKEPIGKHTSRVLEEKKAANKQTGRYS
ncbi:hypothetical protein [Rickettsia endosymbiont of Halotydeus destructor]|uniref:hypothetical protein n=1 Tax=Rickettsia endosymbiont of Halotydeus destructor TaxID=2996754 RepID=UPI003BB1ACCF